METHDKKVVSSYPYSGYKMLTFNCVKDELFWKYENSIKWGWDSVWPDVGSSIYELTI